MRYIREVAVPGDRCYRFVLSTHGYCQVYLLSEPLELVWQGHVEQLGLHYYKEGDDLGEDDWEVNACIKLVAQPIVEMVDDILFAHHHHKRPRDCGRTDRRKSSVRAELGWPRSQLL